MSGDAPLGWLGIVRLGWAQLALGAIAVLATSTLNRIMVVELAAPAIVPGLLVGLHYALQVLRPRWGFAADTGGRRTRLIVGGMAVMATGVTLAAAGAAMMQRAWWPGLLIALAGYGGVGIGMGGMGTALLTLLAARVAPARRAAAATIVWVMMIAGSAITAGVVGHILHPFSFALLIRLVGLVAGLACLVTTVAVAGMDGGGAAPARRPEPFGAALRQVWADPESRRFALFVFASMLAYSGQELILEPFAALVFGLAPADTARVVGLHQGGVLAGMLLVAVAGTAIGGRRASMRPWTVGGCVGSAVALGALALAGTIGAGFPVRPVVFALGVANGAFAVSAIAAMMQLAGRGGRAGGHPGTRMGLFGAAQAIAFGGGGVLSSGASDLGRHLLGSPGVAYAMVFAAEGGLFLIAAGLAGRVFAGGHDALALSHAASRSA